MLSQDAETIVVDRLAGNHTLQLMLAVVEMSLSPIVYWNVALKLQLSCLCHEVLPAPIHLARIELATFSV